MTSLASRRSALALAISALAMPLGAFALTLDSAAHVDKVFTSTNTSTGNQLVVFARNDDGSLRLEGTEATGGAGNDAGLGSQGAVTLSGDGRYLYVVNAGSHSVSTFELHGTSVTLVSVTDSQGLTPISVTEDEGLVFVLNAGGAGNVAGFRNVHGALVAVPGATAALSAAGGTAPAQVGIAGDTLVVTEKAVNQIVTYKIDERGALGPAHITRSSGVTPFGFAVDRRDHVIVSEAAGGAAAASSASSYALDDRSSQLRVISASVPTHQTAACWVAVTPNGRWAFTGNAGDGSISSFRIGHEGSLSLVNAAAGVTSPADGITDIAVSRNGHHIYAITPRGRTVAAFDIQHDGRLQATGRLPVASVHPSGIAAN